MTTTMAKGGYLSGGFFIGFMCGALAAALLTPRTGKDMRHDISRTVKTTVRKAKNMAHDTASQVDDAIEGTKNAMP